MTKEVMALFKNPLEAGRQLAEALGVYANRPDVVVLGVPDRGFHLAAAVARHLQVPLDIVMVQLLEMPGHEDYDLGAIASGRVRVLDVDLLRTLNISESSLEVLASRERSELERREKVYRGDLIRYDLEGRTVILVGDGMSPGLLLEAAAVWLREQGAERIILAFPTTTQAAYALASQKADEVILLQPSPSGAEPDEWYEKYPQVNDAEVRELLHRQRHS